MNTTSNTKIIIKINKDFKKKIDVLLASDVRKHITCFGFNTPRLASKKKRDIIRWK